MPFDVTQSRADIALARANARAKRDEVRQKEYDLASKKAEYEALARDVPADSPELAALKAQVDTLTTERDGLVTAWKGLRTTAHTALTTFTSELATLGADAIFDTTLDANRSIALFPVRLETYFQRVGGTVHLLVRVYPDDVHVEAHEAALTDSEIKAGENFWTAATEAVGAPANRQHFITQDPAHASQLRQIYAQLLVDVGDPERAAYVMRATDPASGTTPLRRSNDYVRRPEARILPDRWLVLGFGVGSRVPNLCKQYGAPIPDPLPLAPFGSLDNITANKASEIFDEETKWLIDFAKAEEVGMGIRINLNTATPAKFEVLMVLGVKASLQARSVGPNADSSSRRLTELFESHRYTDGMAILHDGTPTNAAANERSGYAERPPSDEAYDVEFQADRTTPFDAAKRLTHTSEDHAHRALGFPVGPSASGAQPFRGLANANRMDNSHAYALNFILWRTTWGYYLDQMMNKIAKNTGGPGQTVGYFNFMGETMQWWAPSPGAGQPGYGESPVPNFNYNQNLYGRQHFADYVRSGSWLPTLRVGRQPYGLLPVTSWDDWDTPVLPPEQGAPYYTKASAFDSTQHPQGQWDKAVIGLLKKLRDRYWLPGTNNVASVAKYFGTQSDFPTERNAIVKLLSWGATSSQISAFAWWSMQHQDVWSWGGEFDFNAGEANVTAHRAYTQRALVQLGMSGLAPRIRDLLLAAQQYIFVNAPMVQEAPTSWTEKMVPGLTPETPNYLEWFGLPNQLWFVVDIEAGSEFFQSTKGVPLLYSMLRHAWLMEMAWHPLAYGSTSPSLLLGFRSERFLQQPKMRAPIDFKTSWSNDGEFVADYASYLTMLYSTIYVPSQETTGTIGIYLSALKTRVMNDPDPEQLEGELEDGTSSSLVDGHRIHRSMWEFYRLFATLKDQPTAVLERNTRGVLDLASHRLDAWFTSYANKRLDQAQKALTPSGDLSVHIGGYGWVENLEMRGSDPTGDTPRSVGYAFAPSPAQATTAAVLRGAQIAHSRDASTANLLGVNLSSVRVREAKYLLDGVRQGQPLPALLGYRFERELHEISKRPGPNAVDLDQYILPLRELFPLVAKQLEKEAEPSPSLDESIERIAAGNVVDGLALVRQVRAGGLAWGTAGLPTQGSPAQVAISGAIALLERSVDAVADALLAESVYQGVLGNPPRQGGVFGALNRGENPVPELEVLDTPRSGEALTHRVAVVLQDASNHASEGWASTPRSNAEPRLNSWLARMLGRADRIYARTQQRDAAGDLVAGTMAHVALSQLGVAPIDVVYDAVVGVEPADSILGQRVLTFSDAGLPRANTLEVTFDLAGLSGLPANLALDFDQLLTLADALRVMVTGGRGLRPTETMLANDAATMEVPPGSGPNLTELDGRVTSARTEVVSVQTALNTAITAGTAANVGALRSALVKAANIGISSALPGTVKGKPPITPPPPTDPWDADVLALLLLVAQAVLPEVDRRLTALTALEDAFAVANPTPATTPPEEVLAHHLKRLQTLFGDGFRGIAVFTPVNTDEFQLAATAETSTRIQRGNPHEVTTWLQRTGRVRPSVEAFGDVMLYAGAVTQTDPLALRVAQLPYVPVSTDPQAPAENWIGLDFAGAPPAGDRLSLVLQGAADANFAQPFGGLVIDEWVEVIPSQKSTAALTFHYDTPASRPGQAVLLAVPPKPAAGATMAAPAFQPWTLAALQKMILDTRALARMRVVDLPSIAHFDELWHYLPATFHTVEPRENVTPQANVETQSIDPRLEIDTDFRRNTLDKDGL